MSILLPLHLNSDDITDAVQAWSASPSGLALPRARVVTAGNQSITSSVTSTVIWKLAGWEADPCLAYNTGLIFDTTSGRFTLTAGLYLVTASIMWAASAAGWRFTTITDFTTSGLSQVGQPASSATFALVQQCTAVVPVATTLQLGVQVFQDTGGGLNVTADPTNTWVQVTKIG